MLYPKFGMRLYVKIKEPKSQFIREYSPVYILKEKCRQPIMNIQSQIKNRKYKQNMNKIMAQGKQNANKTTVTEFLSWLIQRT